ncbi:response regulator [Pilimelia terevasa]|uniref:Response regulator n=1 Tax=Pilimelia terevasa TaxID=53372 RepID=A0A8J3BFB2_9ACTN|nr:response regulator [Pilimelia terevasa]GGK17260.1 response regulator [Pilimelia terevasa]
MALILAADDEPAAREVLARVLGRAGHQVVTAPDGETALRDFREHRPDLVLTDVDMPLINGFLLCDEIRRDPARPDTPVVLVTGVINPQDHRAREVGASAVLVKPFTPEDLLAAVEQQLAPPVPTV